MGLFEMGPVGVFLAGLCLAGLAAFAASPEEVLKVARKAPRLPPPPGRVVNVSDARQLKRAIEGAGNGTTILIADGTYKVGGLIYLRRGKDITIRGASGDPTKVVLKGRGWDRVDRGDDILRIGGCENVTVADLTFTDCHAYALKVQAENNPKNIQVYNCRFIDIGTRGIKGSTSRTGRARKGSIRYCYFENTKIPPASWQFGGNYITAIDMMALDDWVISDNVFINLKGRTGNARAAIFIWVRSRNVIAERNLIVDCDRGVAFGNPSGSTAGVGSDEYHVRNGICRNNFIVPGPDSGVELSWVKDIKVYNNTIWRKDAGGRGIRCVQRVGPTEIVNNLVRGEIILKGEAVQRNNVTNPPRSFFLNPDAGDLHLTAAATRAIDSGVPLAEVTDDFDGQARSGAPDLGADEFGRPAPREKEKEKEPGESVWALVAEKLRKAGQPSDTGPLAGFAELVESARAEARAGKYEQAAAMIEKAAEGEEAKEALARIARGFLAAAEMRKWIIDGAASGRKATTWVDIMGVRMRGKVQSADGEGLVVSASGQELPVKWKDLPPKRFRALAKKYAAEKGEEPPPERARALDDYSAAMGLDE